jgi:phospholipid/cholesterol/gamma-HCH transport system ATP-binding protein
MFCDEPSAGLDPAIAAAIDQTLLQFRAALGVTIVIVTHEIASIEAIADRAVMFGNEKIIARGTFAELKQSKDQEVFNFFNRVADESGPAMTTR